MAEELTALLSLVLIRRLKGQVLHQLPPRWRLVVRLDTGKTASVAARDKRPVTPGRAGEPLSAMRQVGVDKLPMAAAWLQDKLPGWQQGGAKIVIFAHHVDVMSQLEERLIKWTNYGADGFIKLDGHVPACVRETRLAQFRANPATTVALVSITAGGQGIDLSVASVCVFVELPPQPGWLRQAEDRLHRQGQRNCVTIYYLLSGSPAEDHRWAAFARCIEENTAILNGQQASEALEANVGVVAPPAPATASQAHAQAGGDPDGDEPDLAGVDWEHMDLLVEMEHSEMDVDHATPPVLATPRARGGLLSQLAQSVAERLAQPNAADRHDTELSPAPESRFHVVISRHSNRMHLFLLDALGRREAKLSSFEQHVLEAYSNTHSLQVQQTLAHELPLELLQSDHLLRTCIQVVREWHELTTRERNLLYDLPLQPPLSGHVRELKAAHTMPASTTRFLSLPELVEQLTPNLRSTAETRVAVNPNDNRSYEQRLCDETHQPLCLLCDNFASEHIRTIQDFFCRHNCFQIYLAKCQPQGLRRLVAARDEGVCEACGLDGQRLLEQLNALSAIADRRQVS